MSKLANGDMIRAIGSGITGSEKRAFSIGLVAHLIAGTFFGFLYALCLSFAPAIGLFGYVLVTTGLGFFHGLVMCMLMIIAVAEHHPLEKFRSFGPAVAVAHLIAHVVYGASIGLILYLVGFDKFHFF